MEEDRAGRVIRVRAVGQTVKAVIDDPVAIAEVKRLEGPRIGLRRAHELGVAGQIDQLLQTLWRLRTCPEPHRIPRPALSRVS